MQGNTHLHFRSHPPLRLKLGSQTNRTSNLKSYTCTSGTVLVCCHGTECLCLYTCTIDSMVHCTVWYVRTYTCMPYEWAYHGTSSESWKVDSTRPFWYLIYVYVRTMVRTGQPDHPWTGSRGLRGNQGDDVRRPAQLRPIHRGDWRLHQQAGPPLP
jgi:hypothetical protein